MSKAMVPVGVIADLVCLEIGDNTFAKKAQILIYIGLGFQKMHLLISNDTVIKSEIIRLGDGLVYELPCDYLDMTKVGLKRGNSICTLSLNTNLQRSIDCPTDSQMRDMIDTKLSSNNDGYDCYFYNVFCDGEYLCGGEKGGKMGAYGTGFRKTFYNIQNGVIQLSPFLVGEDEDLELILEYKSDGLTAGLELVPSLWFLALKNYAKACYFQEGKYGKFTDLWESEYLTVKRVENWMDPKLIQNIFSR